MGGVSNQDCVGCGNQNTSTSANWFFTGLEVAITRTFGGN